MSKSKNLWAILSLLIVLAVWGGSATSGSGKPQARGFRNLFVRFSSGQEVVLAQNGPVALVARCDGETSGVEIFFTSSEDGWFSNSFSRAAGEKAVLCSGGISGRFNQCEGVSGDTSFGVDVLGSDCIVVGSVTTTFDR
jgi:hypothetical protein